MRDQSISYRYQQADGVNIFYREAGDPSLPVLLLLHGFPSPGIVALSRHFSEAKARHIGCDEMKFIGQKRDQIAELM